MEVHCTRARLDAPWCIGASVPTVFAAIGRLPTLPLVLVFVAWLSVGAGDALAARAAQTISFPQPAASSYGAAPFAISATASSGLPVVVESLATTVCAVDGKLVTPLIAGTCKLRASQAGDATWAAAANVSRNVTIAKAAQSITFPAIPGRTFGDPPFAATASSSSGLPVTVASTTTGVCTLGGGVVTIVKAGTCTLKATQAGDANHAAATAVSQGVTIAKAAQAIAFDTPAPRVYGDPAFTIAPKASSGLAVTVTSTTKAVCTISSLTVKLVAAGTCSLHATQGGNANYLAAPAVDRSFAVAQRGQSISFDAIADWPLSTGSIGLHASATSGLAVSFASMTPATCSTSASNATLLAAGTCTIRASQAGNASYPAAAPVDRSFRVTREWQEISFAAIDDVPLAYGAVYVNAVATSGLPLTYASLTPSLCAFQSPPFLALLSAGTCSIRISQGGDARYDPAADVVLSFVIQGGASPDSLRFDDPGPHVVAESPLDPGATSLAGMAIVYRTASPAVCNADGTTLQLLAAGTCDVTAYESPDGANPQGTGLNRSFAVLRTPQLQAPSRVGVETDAARLVAVPRVAASGFTLLAGGTPQIDELTPDGNGAFTVRPGIASAQGFLRGLAAGTIDADDRIDFAAASMISPPTGFINAFLSRGDGTFGGVSNTVELGMPAGLAIADVDGDGNADIIAGLADAASVQGSSFAILYGQGDGHFSGGASYGLCGNPVNLAVADLDDDGLPDFAAACTRDGSVAVARHRTGLGYDIVAIIPDLFMPQSIAVADVDGNGQPELLVGSRMGAVYVLAGDVASGFDVESTLWPGGDGVVRVADVNGDGHLDIVTVDYLGQGVAVMSGGGDGRFSPALTIPLTVPPNDVLAADFDGKGHVDLAVASAADRAIWVLRNQAAIPAVAALVPATPLSQTAALGEAFSAPLAVIASDATGHPVPGVEVRFELAADTPSGMFGNGQRIAIVLTGVDGKAQSPRLRAGRVAGSHVAVARAGNTSVSFSLVNSAVGIAPQWTQFQPPSGTLAAPYDYAFVATGSPLPRITLDSGTLPPGLALSSTGALTGTPTAGGTYAGVLRAANGISPDATVPFSIAIAAYPQTITFAPMADQPLDRVAISVSAVASSGLPVTLTSTSPDVCSAGGNTIGLIKAGRCTIRATQPGNSTYGAAMPVERAFEIGKGSQSVVVSTTTTETRVDWPAFEVSASATSGLPVALDSATPAVCSIAGNRVVSIARGTCTIVGSQAGNASYAPSSASVSVTVRGAAQSINLPPIIDQHLADYPFVWASATSGLPVIITSDTPAICVVDPPNLMRLGSDSNAGLGWCTLTISQPGDERFEPTERGLSFTAGKPPGNSSAFEGNVPHIVYATYLGGWSTDHAFGLVAARDGGPVVAGTAGSSNLPGLSSRQFTDGGLDMIFVSKLQPGTAAIDYSSAVAATWSKAGGGSIVELAGLNAVAIDRTGQVFAAGHEGGADFPVTGGTYRQYGPFGVFKVDGIGNVMRLVSGLDPAIKTVRAIAADDGGALYLTGVAAPGLTTTAGAAIGTAAVSAEAPYLLKLSPAGSVVYSTYLGVPGSRPGAGNPDGDQGTNDAGTTSRSVVVDASGYAYVGGHASARDLPATPGALDSADHNNDDGFIMKVAPSGNAIAYVARLGFRDQDRITSLALAPDGTVVFAGKSASADDFVGGGSFQSAVRFSQNHSVTTQMDREFGFVGKLDASGSTWSFLAGVGTWGGDLVRTAMERIPNPLRVAVDATGNIYLAGRTSYDRSLPTKNLLEGMPDEGVFLMKITPSGAYQHYSVIVGEGRATGLALDGKGNAYVAGDSFGVMPTIGTPQADCAIGYMSQCASPFLVKVSDLEAPVVLGTSSSEIFVGASITLTARVADSTATGTIEIYDDGLAAASAPLANGTASLSLTPGFGFHHYTAKYAGSSDMSGLSSTGVMVQVSQMVLP